MKYKTVYVGAAVIDSFALFQALCVLYRDGSPPQEIMFGRTHIDTYHFPSSETSHLSLKSLQIL